jgi:hypothetical protein
MGRTQTLTREQIQGRKDKAVRFVRDVVGDPDRAAEIEAEDVEAYAERRKLRLKNPMQQDREAWQKGFDAGARGARATCPYSAGTVEAWSWQSGFTEGRSSRKTNTASALNIAERADRISRAMEILSSAYRPSTARGDLVMAIRESLEVLRGRE